MWWKSLGEIEIAESVVLAGQEGEAQLKEATGLLESGEHWQAIREALDVKHAGDNHLKLLVFVICLSSGLREKVHFWAVGRSQMGKSHLESVMEDLFPNVLVYDSQSPLFLIYETKEQGAEYLRGKIVLLEEANDSLAVWGLVKRLTSADKERVTHGTVIKGRPITLEIDGIPVVLSNSVETSVDEQVNNRFIIGNVDEGEDQDLRIEKLQNREAQGLGTEKGRRRIDLAREIVTQILSEQAVDVLIPSAEFIEIPMGTPRVNRKKFMRLVKAITYGNRFVRAKAGDLYIATEADVRFAYRLWLEVQAYQRAQLDETGIKILREVPFDRHEPLEAILERLAEEVNPSTARKRLKKMFEQSQVDERTTKEIDYNEEGRQTVIPGWSLEYRRMVPVVDDVDEGISNPFPGGFPNEPSPLKGTRNERARHYKEWGEGRGGFLHFQDFHETTKGEGTSIADYVLEENRGSYPGGGGS